MRAAAIFGLGTSPDELKRFRAGSATQWMEGIPASSHDADAIVMFGGDGTIHRHLPALVRLQLPLLVVPSGSGNDFARALKLGSVRESLRAWRGFESGTVQPRAVDLGTITQRDARLHYFCCVAGCGLDAAVARRANRMPRWLRGHGGYALGLAPTIFRFSAFPLRLTQYLEHNRTESNDLTIMAAFANTQFYGGGMKIAPQAHLNDGRIDVCRITAMNPFKLFCMFPSVYFGRHLWIRQVKYSQAERVCLETDKPTNIYADGEFVCQTPVEIGVARGLLRVIVAAA